MSLMWLWLYLFIPSVLWVSLAPSIPHVALEQYSNTPLYSPECQHIRRLGGEEKKRKEEEKKYFPWSTISLIKCMCAWIDFEVRWFVRYTVWHQFLCKFCLFLYCPMLYLFIYKKHAIIIPVEGVYEICIFIHKTIYIEKQNIVPKRHN